MKKMLLAGLAGAALLLYLSVFTVDQREKAIKFRLGEIVKSDYDPGLHFMMPIVNNVRKFDGRVLTLDLKPERFLTLEKKNLIVDSFVKWRIDDVKKYYTSVGGDKMQANLRLDQVIKDAMRSEFSQRTIRQLVSEDRKAIRAILIEYTAPVTREFGLDVVDIRIERIDLPKEVSDSVYRRMEAERARVAREFRSQGAEAAERIRADADRQKEIIVADAFRGAEIKRGAGDAKAAETYASAYRENPEFFAFYRSLNAYESVFDNKQNRLVLEPDSDFFKYFMQERQ